jgi:mannose-1-phosphate guanylyltransferase
MATYVVILAGGAGTRFWPASRSERPKQLLPLTGGGALIAETAKRVKPLVDGPHRIFVATGKKLVDATMHALPEIPQQNFFAEPVARNTAPCIAWVTKAIAERDVTAEIIVLPSDHHIVDEEAFRAVLRRALDAARGGHIATIGIVPTRPDTGFGYIELETPPKIEAVIAKRFVEKPDRSTAEAFVASGRYLWNGGMFIYRAVDMLNAIATHAPDLLTAATTAVADPGQLEYVFSTVRSVSIDVAIMEKLPEIAVVPANVGWSDVGSWQAAYELGAKDELGNVAPTSSVLLEAKGNHVVDLSARSGRTIAIVGVEDLVVVETDDATLIIPRSRCQDVRDIVEALRARGEADKI